ncbi:MAG: hypothetical protein ACXVK3_14760 [Candidatus Angelobacter sp.]
MMALFRYPNSNNWWYEFQFSGQRIRESTKTKSKKLATEAERARRRELEEVYNGVKRRDKAKLFSVAAEDWLALKKLTLAPSSTRIERDNLKHLLPRFGRLLVTDIEALDISKYQLARLAAAASPKTVNLEVGLCEQSSGATGHGQTFNWTFGCWRHAMILDTLSRMQRKKESCKSAGPAAPERSILP